MAKNDLVLLDSILEKRSIDRPDLKNIGDHFDIFVFDNIFKDYDLSDEEIEQGWVEGTDDGGIDGFFVFLDGIFLSEIPKSQEIRKYPDIEVVVVTCKHEASFRQIPLNNILASIPELFDLSMTSDSFKSEYNEGILEQRDLFCNAYKELSARQPSLKFTFIYASRGDVSGVADNIIARKKLIEARMSDYFSNCTTSFTFNGASELLQMTRKKQSSNLELTFIENYVSRAQSNYVVLAKLNDYYKFITDEQGNLRRYLFDSNVRDFLGRVPVNEDIALTLNTHSRIDQCDFWWLNNGVTIIATAANIAGKEINLENIQIVNGLQTTENIFGYLKNPNISEDRAVLVKIIVTQDVEVRDKIIKATNFQTPVELASLRATDKIQRDIEDILLRHNWFYDRRKNYYKNQGKPLQRIVSPSYLASCVLAIVFKDPIKASRLKTRFMRVDEKYFQIFNDKLDIRIYPFVLDLAKNVEQHLLTKNPPWAYHRFLTDCRCLFPYVWLVKKFGSEYNIGNILNTNPKLELSEIDYIWSRLNDLISTGKFKPKRLFKNQKIIDVLISETKIDIDSLIEHSNCYQKNKKRGWFGFFCKNKNCK